MVEKTKLKWNNYLEEDGIYYIGIPKSSNEKELDALVSLLMSEIEVEHEGRKIKGVKLSSN